MTRVVSLFSGIGGFEHAFLECGAQIVFSNDFDKKACETNEFMLNKKFGNVGNICCDDIINITNKVPKSDILCAGFPCQSFSLAGERLGFNDCRGQLFYRIMDVVDLTLPRVLFLENVKNLINHDNGHTILIIKNEIEKRGYNIDFFQVLNTMYYTRLPQNRERIFIIASIGGLSISNLKTEEGFDQIIDPSKKEKDKYYYKLGENYLCNDKYRNLVDQINEIGEFYQIRRGMYVRKNAKSVCPTMTANMGSGGHNVAIIKDNFGVRKLTPQECFYLQGFDVCLDGLNISDCHLYKQAGNSVSVPLVKKLARKIMENF